MLLCDVALGEMFETDQSDPQITAPPDGYDSMHGVKATEEKTSFFQVICSLMATTTVDPVARTLMALLPWGFQTS